MRRWTLLLILATLTGLLALRAAPAPALAAGPQPPLAGPLNRGGRAHILPLKGAGPSGAARSIGAAGSLGAAGGCALGCSPPLLYHGGPVMPSTRAYAIFWLPSTNQYDPSAGDASYKNLISRYFTDVGGSPFYNILTQYSTDPTSGATVTDGPILNSATFGGAWLDTSGYGGKGSTSNPLLDSDIQAEVTKAIGANQWTPSLTTIFFVYTGLGVQSCFDASHTTCTFFSQTQYCAYHSNGDGVHAAKTVLYGNMPDMADCEQLLPSSPNNDPYADSAINLTSHEFAEAITDPDITAWYDGGSYGYEIGDECAWIFGPTTNGADLTLNGHPYLVQEEWSNADNACVLSAAAPGAPGAPTNVTASAGNAQATVTWTTPASSGNGPITGYTVTTSPGGATAGVSAPATSATVTGLSNGTSYTFTVTATNAIGTGPASAPSNAVAPTAPTPPGAPTAVSAVAGNAQAAVSWTAPASTGTSPITGYTVTASPGGATATASGSATGATVSGLTNGTSYTFTVHAGNVAGNGPESSASNLVTPSATPAMSFSGSKIGTVLCTCNTLSVFIGGVACTTTLPLTYNSPFSLQAGCGTAGQAVTFAINGTAAGLITSAGTSCIAFAPGATVSGLQVASGYSQNTSCATVPGLPTAPGAPTGVTATAGSGQATVNWTAPSSNGGSPITSYTVTASPGGATVSVSAPATTATVTGLANGTSYTFKVTATNAIGAGPASAPSNAVTPSAPVPPGAPTTVSAVAGNAQATISWTAPTSTGNSPITGYTITASPGGLTTSAPGSATSGAIAGLTNGTPYTFTVHATNVAGSGPESAASNLVTPSAAAPMTLAGSKIGTGLCSCNTLSVAIGGIVCTTTLPLTYNSPFSLQAGCGTAGQAVTFAINGAPAGLITSTGTSCVAFAPGTAVNGVQVASGYSQNTSCATVPGLPTAPGAPTGVAATAGNGQATVTWLAPSNNGGSVITGYTVTASPGGATTGVSAPATSATVTGLANGTSYTFTVTATNAIGTGPASAPSNAVTPSAPVPPGAPANVSAVAGNAQATVAWTAPSSTGNSPITGYTVTASPGGATASVAGTATSAVVSGLTNGNSYTFTIHATNVAGSSPESAPSNLVTPSTTAPMTLAGSKIGGSLCSCNTLSVAVGGVICTTQTGLSYNAAFSMQAGCGTAGQSITFAVNGAPAGLQMATDATCLALNPGASVTGIEVSTGFAQSTTCATAAAPARRTIGLRWPVR